MKYVQWVKSQGWSWAKAARQLGVANATQARRYAYGALPPPQMMARIYLASGGQVAPNDFYDLPPLPAAPAAEAA